MKKYLKELRKTALKKKIASTNDTIQSESADKIYGRRFDQLLTLHQTRITTTWAMEAVSLMIMKIQFDRGDFNQLEKLRETTSPILLNAPVDHLPLYPGLWESTLRSRMEYWRVDY